jgi:tetratricopeptide (TPR) repeat protein
MDQAEQLAQRSLALRPDHTPTLILLALAARAQDHTATALDAARLATRLAPDQAEPAFLLCVLLLKAGDPAAHDMLGSLVAKFPREARGWEDIGQVLAQAGKTEAALLCLSRASEVAPSFSLAMHRGVLSRDLGRVAEALESFEQAVTLNPRSTRAWFLLGLCRQDHRMLPSAAEAYRTALTIDPTLAEAFVNLGTVLQETGDLSGAKAAYGSAVQLRNDTFGRVAQAMTSSPKGELWLNLAALRHNLTR